jgi:hypothetical protein
VVIDCPYECLADAVPIADLVTCRKRAGGKPCEFHTREIGGPVRLLGLLLGLTQGQMKKLKERQDQIENSR